MYFENHNPNFSSTATFSSTFQNFFGIFHRVVIFYYFFDIKYKTYNFFAVDLNLQLYFSCSL